jgi:pimeloyl-ACP methyl ester carboxylesterase
MRVFACLLLLAVAPSVAAQPPVRAPQDGFVTVDGLRIHYVDWGTPAPGAPAFIMVHGLDRNARTFDHLVPHFAGRYRVIAMDLRGHGESGWDPQARYLVEDHARDLAGLIRQLGLRQVVLWGNSTGGRVVQVVAAEHPDLVSHVIAEDVGPDRPRQIADAYARRVKQEENGWGSIEEATAALRSANPTMPAAVIDPYVRYGTRRREDGRIVWKRDPNLVKGFVETDLWRFVRRIKAPLLYVIGGRSTIVPPATQAAVRAALPQARLVTIANAGHYPSEDQPAEFVAIVVEFLRNPAGPG